VNRFTDTNYLREEQYRDDTNLRARIDLHRRFSTNPEPWHRWVFDRFEFGPDDLILEVGCGPAELWAENLERIPPGWRLTFVDLSPGMIERARAVLDDRATYEVADLQDLPFANESFDGVIANHMLYHVPDRARALSEIARVLRSGGRFYAASNGRGHLKEIHALRSESRRVGFLLETAGDELEELFDNVRLEHYDCDLEVTEVEPVLAFVRSAGTPPLPEAVSVVREEIARRGSFHVTKSSGMFVCGKP
jgi:SAM-dependent methyltransferase